jgi:hypothetical protein
MRGMALALALLPVMAGAATREWRSMKSGLTKDEFEVATDLYYINVSKQ